MADQQWVDQVRELLARAAQRHGEISTEALKSSINCALQEADDMRREAILQGCLQVPYPIRRRTLLAQIGMHARYNGLDGEVESFIAVAGCRVIQELDNDQLAALAAWLGQWVDNMQVACDSAYAPPAR